MATVHLTRTARLSAMDWGCLIAFFVPIIVGTVAELAK